MTLRDLLDIADDQRGLGIDITDYTLAVETGYGSVHIDGLAYVAIEERVVVLAREDAGVP